MDRAQMTQAEMAAIAASPRNQERMAEIRQAAAARPSGLSETELAETTARIAARRMADDMLDIAAAKGCCEDRDLIGRGWTAAALAAYGDAANRLALARAGEARAVELA